MAIPRLAGKATRCGSRTRDPVAPAGAWGQCAAAPSVGRGEKINLKFNQRCSRLRKRENSSRERGRSICEAQAGQGSRVDLSAAGKDKYGERPDRPNLSDGSRFTGQAAGSQRITTGMTMGHFGTFLNSGFGT